MDKIKLNTKGEEPLTCLNDYVDSLNKQYKKKKLLVIIKKDSTKIIDKNIQASFNCRCLFLIPTSNIVISTSA